MLAFQKANPKFGSVGHNTEAAVSSPLPGCLDTMIKQSLLTNAKRDKLALVKASLATDKEVVAAMPAHRAALHRLVHGEDVSQRVVPWSVDACFEIVLDASGGVRCTCCSSRDTLCHLFLA